jgi:predicted RNase H-like HicB family nuclease
MQFNIVIERDEDGRYVAECLDLPGCLSEGETLEEALGNIGEAILGCLKSRLKLLLEKRSWIEIPVKGEVAVRFDTSGVLQYAQAA